jgi:hypothetical protein
MFQMLVRDGFDIRRHALSLLTNGDLGWIQILNFVLTGLLVIAGGGSPVDGNFNHGQARPSGSDAQEFVTALNATLFIYFCYTFAI